jgi:hypothetical protein
VLRPLLRYAPGLPRRPALTAGDAFIVVATAAILYAGVRLAIHTPRVIAGPDISLQYSVLPWYTILSVCRIGRENRCRKRVLRFVFAQHGSGHGSR